MKKEEENASADAAQPWSVWLVRSHYGTRVEQFFGGEIAEPYKNGVVAVYATKTDTQRYSPNQVDEMGRVLIDGLYDKPIAWLVQQPDSPGVRPYITLSYGNPVRNPDEDDVVAVFRTEKEAHAYIDDRDAAARAERARTPDWRTLPDNCLNCGHPKIWHYGACIWEDDVNENGHWALCLKNCPQYVAPSPPEGNEPRREIEESQ